MPDEIACHPALGSEVVAVPLDEPDAKIDVFMAWRKCESSMAVLALLTSTRQVFRIPSRCALAPRDRSRFLSSSTETG
jgi:hypothetical protein